MDRLINNTLYALTAMAEDASEDGNDDRARLLTACERTLKAEIERLESESDRLRAAIQQTLDDNLSLTDGDVCTLILLKRAIETPNDQAQTRQTASDEH